LFQVEVTAIKKCKTQYNNKTKKRETQRGGRRKRVSERVRREKRENYSLFAAKMISLHVTPMLYERPTINTHNARMSSLSW